MNRVHESFDRHIRISNLSGNLWMNARDQIRISQPVMSNHATFVGIGDGTAFQSIHRLEGRRHLLQEIILEMNANHIEDKPQRLMHDEVVAIALPELWSGQLHGEV